MNGINAESGPQGRKAGRSSITRYAYFCAYLYISDPIDSYELMQKFLNSRHRSENGLV